MILRFTFSINAPFHLSSAKRATGITDSSPKLRSVLLQVPRDRLFRYVLVTITYTVRKEWKMNKKLGNKLIEGPEPAWANIQNLDLTIVGWKLSKNVF